MEFERYLLPVSDATPGGRDLDEVGFIYTVDRMIGWSENSQLSQKQWRDIREKVEEGLAQSRDLRLGVALAVALLNLEGIAGFVSGVAFIRRLVDESWGTIFPPVEEGGNADARRSALLNFVSFYRVLRPLQRAPLVDAPGIGRFSALDVDLAEGKGSRPADYEHDPPQLTTVDAAFAASDPANLSSLANQLGGIAKDLAAICAVFDERVSDYVAPEFDRLLDLLRRCEAILRQRLPVEADPVAEGSDATAASAAGVSAQVTGPPGALRSRRDAILAMQRVAKYFMEAEPSSPVPLLLERAIRLTEADFLTIVEDLAPDAMVQARLLRGQSRSDS